MSRHAPALLALSIIAVAGWTYNVNYDTRAALDRLSELRAEIAEQREALQVLRVEWAYLNAPDRLAALVVAHNEALGLAPLLPDALAIAAAVPYPPRETPEDGPAAPDALLAAAPPGLTAVAPAGTAPAARQAPARPAAAGLEPETTTVMALADAGVARPALLAAPPAGERASLSPIPAALEVPAAGAETVPDALEAAIAAALVEVGVPVDDGPARSRSAPAASPARILGVAASGVPMPAARPGVRSRP